MAIRKHINGIETWFIKGIVSKAPVKENVCDEPFVTTTNTTLYLDFIKKNEIEFRPTANTNGKLYARMTETYNRLMVLVVFNIHCMDFVPVQAVQH